MLRLIFAASLAAVPFVAVGQSMIYKVQMPDGSVLYSDSVPSGGKVLEEREVKKTSRVSTAPSQPGKGASQATPTVITRPTASSPGGFGAAKMPPPANVATLERDLAVAKRQLELGREPLPGERRGTAGGASRLTPEYEARIAGMEREIASIEAKLRDAYAKR